MSLVAVTFASLEPSVVALFDFQSTLSEIHFQSELRVGFS